MELGRQSHSSMALVSRLDHLDFIMKYLEGKQNLSKWGGNNSIGGGDQRPSLPLDTAIREAYFKGSLLDRVAALENRLFQLCLELESSSTSSTSTGISGESSSQGSKREVYCSLPTFNINPNQGLKQESQVLVNKPQIQKKSQGEQQRKNNPMEKNKHQNVKNKPSKDEKTCKSGKKRTPPKWPHLKLLGC